MEKSSCSERRLLPRYILPGGIRLDQNPQGPPFEILDISIGGIRFETDKKLPLGDPVEFWFDYYDFEFRIKCTVAWNRLNKSGSWEHGARFAGVTRAESIVIHEYVKDLRYAIAHNIVLEKGD